MDRKTNIMKSILVTGGAGYIGSHVCYALKQQGYLPICFDNFSSGHRWAAKFGPIVEGDLLESQEIERTIEEYKPFSIIHLASFIQVGESVKNPAKYYENNIAGTINLLKAVQKYEIPYLVFSTCFAQVVKLFRNPLHFNGRIVHGGRRAVQVGEVRGARHQPRGRGMEAGL